MISNRVRTSVITVVTSVWVVNFAAGFVLSDYQPSESVNGVFMLIVGGLFALGSRKGDGPGGEGGAS